MKWNTANAMMAKIRARTTASRMPTAMVAGRLCPSLGSLMGKRSDGGETMPLASDPLRDQDRAEHREARRQADQEQSEHPVGAGHGGEASTDAASRRLREQDQLHRSGQQPERGPQAERARHQTDVHDRSRAACRSVSRT